MHPIIKEYLGTNTPLVGILEKFYNKNNFLESVFLEITKEPILPIESSVYSKIGQAITTGHPDENVYFLFIAKSIIFASYHQQSEKAKSIFSISASLSQENIYPAIQAFYWQAIANLKFYQENFNECIQIAQKSMQLVEQNHPRYSNLLLGYTSMLAGQGRLNELSAGEREVFDASYNDYYANHIFQIKINNCIQIGDYQQGFSIIEDFQKENSKEQLDQISDYIDLFSILSGELNELHFQDESFKLISLIFYNLSEGKIEEAVKFNKLFLNKNNRSRIAGYLNTYLPVNFELAMGNTNAARKILKEMESICGVHYLDDLFYVRIQLIENNFAGARRSMSRLLDNVERYGALNRIKFELQFAKELNHYDFILLMRDWKNIKSSKVAKILKTPAINLKPKGVKSLLGKSFEIGQIKVLIRKYAPLKEIILITGETGTGKELVAKAIHEESSFSKEPFIAINCGALTDTLLESELFGYEAGSFTGAVKQKKGIFESAGKGTVFLDEFGDISPKLQVSLLRVLESNEIRMIGGTSTRKVECRIVVATNIELKMAVETKKFREDLFFRLARFEIRLPPLRKRVGDIAELVKYFLEGSQGVSGLQKTVSKELIQTLETYPWPGNIRELKNCIDRLRILNPEKDILNIEDLNFIQFQGEISLPKNTEPRDILKDRTKEPPEEKHAIHSNDDPIFNIIIQNGFKSEQRVLYLKQLFQKYKILTRGQVTEIAKVNPITATKDLQKLCDEGFIIKKTPTKSYRSNYYEII